VVLQTILLAGDTDIVRVLIDQNSSWSISA